MPAKKRSQAAASRAVALPLKGRPKGTPNKVSAQAKDNILDVFLRLGGVTEMTKWARKHQTEFYTRIYARLLPKDVELGASQGLEELLGQLAEMRSNGEAQLGEYTEVTPEDTVQ